MSMFFCSTCDNLRDSDDGCEEASNGLDLICAECADNLQAAAEEADTFRRANPLEPGFQRLDK